MSSPLSSLPVLTLLIFLMSFCVSNVRARFNARPKFLRATACRTAPSEHESL